MASLQHIFLVDTDGVDPQGAWLVQLTDVEEGGPQIRSDHEGTSIDLYRRQCVGVPPDIA